MSPYLLLSKPCIFYLKVLEDMYLLLRKSRKFLHLTDFVLFTFFFCMKFFFVYFMSLRPQKTICEQHYHSPHPEFSDLPTALVPVMALKAHQITIKVKVSHIIHATYTRHTAHMVNYSQVKNCLDMIPIIWSTFELTEFTWYIMQLSLPHHCFS